MSATAPLAGVRIIDLTWAISGPFATMLLADLGAEVIKAEPPGGDMARSIPPHRFHDDSSFFLSVNRNKKSVVLDLKTPDGQAALDELVTNSDVVYSNFSPEATRRLGLDYDRLRELNPSIIASRIYGFHDEPPYEDLPAFDSVVQAMGGIMSITGPEDGPGVRVGYQIGDLGGGLYSALATLSALYARTITGKGREVDVSLFDSQISLLTWQAQNYLISGEVPGPLGTKHPMIVPNQAFPTADGRQIVVSPTGEKFWRSFCAAIERPDLTADPRFADSSQRHTNRDALDAILNDVFRQRNRDIWLDVLTNNGIPAAPVLDVAEAVNHPLTRLRDMIVNVPHPLGGTLDLIGNPMKTGHPQTFTAPPTLGQHTRDVLTRPSKRPRNPHSEQA